MKRTLSILLTLLLACTVSAQSMKELQKQKKQALQKMETTSKLINETQKNKKASINQLNLIQAQLKERTGLIQTLDKEINACNEQMNRLKAESASKQKKLEALKKDYAALLYNDYYHKNLYRRLLFVLSADRLDESIRRLRYMHQYADHCRLLMAEMERTKKELDEKLEETEVTRLQRMQARSDKKKETDKLAAQQKKQTQVVNDLKKQEKTLKAQLAKQQKTANALNSKIERIIAEEARKEEEKRRAAAAKKSGTTTKPSSKPTPATDLLTPEEKTLSSNFTSNKGKLPWPTAKGTITGHYGVHQHPTLKQCTINNKGIYMQCPKGTEVRAVFDGEVTQKFAVSTGNNVVIVRHGNYRTVYANLSSVYVKVGSKVKTKQALGTILHDSEENKTELYFQLFNGQTIENPELWLAR